MKVMWLSGGERILIDRCAWVQAGERVVIMTDSLLAHIVEALAAARYDRAPMPRWPS